MNFFDSNLTSPIGRGRTGDPNSGHHVGVGAGAGGAGAAHFPLSNSTHQIDLNHLWTQVQELSSILASNRENASNIQKKVEKIKKRVEDTDGVPLFPSSTTTTTSTSLPTTTTTNDNQQLQLQQQPIVPSSTIPEEEAALLALQQQQNLSPEETIDQLRRDNSTLQLENEELSYLVADYETILEKILESLRVYAYEHSVSTINIHQSYANQLAQERQTNAMLRQSIMDMQSKLADFAGVLRRAHQAEWPLEPEIVIEELKSENAMLREALKCGDPPL